MLPPATAYVIDVTPTRSVVADTKPIDLPTDVLPGTWNGDRLMNCGKTYDEDGDCIEIVNVVELTNDG
jgi:hypothetical protein